MTAKKGKIRSAVLDTLGYTEIMGPIFDAGIWETAVGFEGNPSKVRLRVSHCHSQSLEWSSFVLGPFSCSHR